MKIYSIIVGILLCLLPILLWAQPKNNAIGDVAMPAPTAAALGKYGDVPVSYYTGVPNISVPIYTISEGNISLPISLSYHASGIKLGELASSTGLNWSLIGPGIISRTVLGAPDEMNQGYFNSNGELLDPDHVDNIGTQELTDQINDVTNGDRDAEPDMFSFNIAGHSGKFFFDRDKEPVFVPQSDLKLKYKRRISGDGMGTMTPREFHQFTLITPDGTKYIFGKLDSDTDLIIHPGVETTIVNNQETLNLAPSSWYLRQIVSHDDIHKIELEYEADNYQYANLGSCQYRHFSETGLSPSCSGITQVTHDATVSINNSVVSGWRIKSVKNSTNTTQLDFKYSEEAREDLDPYLGMTPKRLDTIEVTSGDYCTAFDLSYSYYTSLDGTDSYYKRLKLDAVQERSCDNSLFKPAWTFDYIPGELPNRYSRQIDHWGFYNGQTLNEATHNIPDFTVAFNGETLSFPFPKAERESNISRMQMGTLEKITYPTGGHTLFEYEANKVSHLESLDGTLSPVMPEISNCGHPGEAACCDNSTATGTESFTAEEIDGAVFRINITNNILCNGNIGNYPKIILFVRRIGSTNSNDFNKYEFDVDANCMSCLLEEDLAVLEREANFLPGEDYKFDLIINNGSHADQDNIKASFQVFSEVEGATQLVQRDVGGLRIKKMTTHDGFDSNNDIIRSYTYLNNDDSNFSSGKLFFEPGYYGIQKNIFGEDAGLTYHSTSVVPLASYNGNHIGYSRVVETLNENGRNEYIFLQEEILPGDEGTLTGTNNLDERNSYPYIPDLARVNDGQQLIAKVYGENNEILSQNLSTYYQNYSVLPIDYIIYKGATYNNSAGEQGFYHKRYTIRTAPSNLLIKSISTIDGIETTTDFTYNLNHHLAPIAIEKKDIQGNTYRTEHTYVFDDLSLFNFDNPLYDTMIIRNMIATPLQTIEKNNGVFIKGSRTLFNSFDKTSGGPGVLANNPSFYPNFFYKYEMSVDEMGQTFINTTGNDGWIQNGYISNYDPISGQPKSFSKPGWAIEQYTWNTDNHLLEKRQFEDFEWNYLYYPNTKMVQTITDMDGQEVHYEYDELMRLEKTTSQDNGVNTFYDYVYQDANNNGLNYVNEKTTFEPDFTGYSDLTEMESRQYQDGLGRTVQTVQIKHSPDQKDVVTGITYDNQGRPSRQYEPIESTHDDGSYISVPAATHYTLTEYEASPLNRDTAVTPPDWDFSTGKRYGTNTVADAVQNLVTGSTYPINSLYKTTIIDGNGHKNIQFTDFRGKTILNRRTNGTETELIDTYTLYDVKERPAQIIPPGAAKDNIDLVYKYLYNFEDQVTEKFIPGASSTLYEYDNRDLQIGMQDANMRNDGVWMSNIYDPYGRVTKTGIGNTAGSILPDRLWTQTAYDGYDLDGMHINTHIINKGKTSATKTAILDGNNVVNHLQTYDYTYNGIGLLLHYTEQNHLGGIDVNSFGHDYAGNVLYQVRDHSIAEIPGETVITVENYYDHQGRLTDTYHEINDLPRQLISQLDYTVKDQIAVKRMGGAGSSALQTVNYDYLPNGFLSDINKIRSIAEYDLFQLKLHYKDAFADISAPAQYNGNISFMTWEVEGASLKAYGFQYDYLDRLTQAVYKDFDNLNPDAENRYGSNYTYDERGNVLSLQRNSGYWNGNSYETVVGDDLAMQYSMDNFGQTTGNQLQSVTDNAPVNFGPQSISFPSGTVSSTSASVPDYIEAAAQVDNTQQIHYQAGMRISLEAGFNSQPQTNNYFQGSIHPNSTPGSEFGSMTNNQTATMLYDDNGNLVEDQLKKIEISYNYFNLPSYIEFDKGKPANAAFLKYLYTADGTKLQKNDLNGYRYYCQGIEYTFFDTSIDPTLTPPPSLEAIYHSEGRVVEKNGTFEYQYNLTDHLGNNRILFTDDGTGKAKVLQENHYYPFGLAMRGEWEANGSDSPVNRYLYNGKELDTDFGLNWYHYGARMYDPAIGRFTGVDLLAEMYSFQSTYAYAANNPISNIDIFGMAAASTQELIDKVWEQGNGTYDNDGNRIEETDDEDCCPGNDRKFEQRMVNDRAVNNGEDPREAWNNFLDATRDTEMGLAAGKAIVFVGSYYVGGAVVGLVFKVGGRLVTVAVGTKTAAQGVSFLSKALKPIDKLDEIRLFRGTTGSEGSGSVLFLTDDAAVAATYVKNGGKVVEGTFSKVQLERLTFSGQLEKLRGLHGTTGKSSIEYKFIGSELKKAVISLMK